MIAWLIAAAASVAVELPTVVVEASRIGQTKLEMASHVDVISREEIESVSAASAVDVLEKRANLFFRKPNGNSTLAQIALRGYGANSFGRTKIIVDGEELNNPDMATQDLLRLPVDSIERVEILHGPQTVLHGGNASAGVVNIVTDANSYERRSVLAAHVGSFGQAGTSAGTHGGFADEEITYFGDFSFDRSDGWRRNSGFEAWSVKGGVRQNFERESFLALNVFYAMTQYGLPGGLLTMDDWEARATRSDTPDDWARNDVFGLNLLGEGVLNDENRLTGRFSFRRRQSTADYVSARSETRTLADGFNWELGYGNTSELGGFDNRLDLGTDHRLEVFDGESAARNEFTRYVAAVFVREEFFPLKSLSLFAGARGEGYRAWNVLRDVGGRSATEGSRGAVSAEAGVNWHPFDDVKVYGKWSRFHHAPLADEMFSYYGTANLGLRPEIGQNVELGLDVAFLNEFNLTFTGYHTMLRDEIMYLNYANVNAPDETARTGFETSLAWRREKTGSAGVLYSIVHARFEEGAYRGNVIPLVPAQRLRVFGEYFLLDELAVNGGFLFTGEQGYGGDYAGDGGRLPSFGIFDAGIRVMPSWGGLQGLTIALTVDNLFDRRYCDYAEYFNPWYVYPAAGRSWSLSVRFVF